MNELDTGDMRRMDVILAIEDEDAILENILEILKLIDCLFHLGMCPFGG